MFKMFGVRTESRRRRFLGNAARLGAALSVLAVTGAAGPVVSLSGSSKKATSERAGAGDFEFYLSLTANRPLRDELGRDPFENLDLSDNPYSRNTIDISGWKLARYRRQGPHLIAMQNQNLAEHMAELEKHVPQLVPVGFDGVIIIDYEPYWALWERTPNNASSDAFDAFDSDYKDDWRDYIREFRTYLLDGLNPDEQEEIYKITYEAFMRTFLLATYYKCKALRPRAQWGYYNYPQVLISSDLTPPGVQGYGDLTHYASQLNDQMDWFYEAVDFVSPRIYPSRKVPEVYIPDEVGPGEIRRQVHERWLSSMVRESVRLAKGKPVYPYHSPIFYSNHPFEREAVERFQHEEVYRICAENGAAGVIVWHAVGSRFELTQWDELWENELKPAGVNADRAINGGPGS